MTRRVDAALLCRTHDAVVVHCEGYLRRVVDTLAPGAPDIAWLDTFGSTLPARVWTATLTGRS